MSNYKPEDFKSALIYIKDRFGTDIFEKPERIMAVFSDIAPNLKNDRTMLERMAKLGILKEFAAADRKSEAEKKHVIAVAMDQLTKQEFIQQQIAEKYLSDLCDVFSWDTKPVSSYSKNESGNKNVNNDKNNTYLSKNVLTVDDPQKTQNNTVQNGGNSGLIIAAILILFVALAGGGIYFINRPQTAPSGVTPQTPSAVIPDEKESEKESSEATKQETEKEASEAADIVLNVYGADANNRIVVEADNSKIETLNYVGVDTGLSVSANPEYIYADQPGTTTVVYTVTSNSEKYGNAKKTFEQTFVVKDTRSPVISLAEKTVTVKKGNGYDPYDNVSISDEVDSKFSYVSSASSASGAFYTISNNLNTNKKGVYTISVYAEDSSGNSSEASFTVKVQEQERFVAQPSGCNSKRTDYDTLFREMDQYGKEYTSPSYSTKDEMRMALKEFENQKYPTIPCQVYPGLHISDGEDDEWIFYDYNPWDN